MNRGAWQANTYGVTESDMTRHAHQVLNSNKWSLFLLIKNQYKKISIIIVDLLLNYISVTL